MAATLKTLHRKHKYQEGQLLKILEELQGSFIESWKVKHIARNQNGQNSAQSQDDVVVSFWKH